MKNKRNTARFLSFLTVLAVLLTAGIVLGINASAAELTSVKVSTAEQLKAALTGEEFTDDDDVTGTLADGGTIVLTADVYMGTDATCTVAAKTVTITSKEGSTYTIYRGVKGQTATTITVARPMFTLSQGANVTLTNVVLDGQKDVIADKATTGGAFCSNYTSVKHGTLTLGTGATIQNFAAKQGGAIGLKYGTVIIDGGTISGNVTSTYGGGIDGNSTRIEFNRGTISNNTAGTHGGGIYLRNLGELIMGGEDSVISNCTAVDAGGGICVYGSKAQNLSCGKVTGCEAARGGGIAKLSSNANCKVTLSGIKISGNTATGDVGGGGVYFINGGELVLAGSTISENKAPNGNGGGIFFTDPSLVMKSGTVSGNEAANGGGVYFTTGTLTMTGGVIGDSTPDDDDKTGNVSKGSGGGIMIAGAGTLTMNGGTIAGNHATGTGTSGNGGGGIGASSANATIILSGTAKITNNTADDEYATFDETDTAKEDRRSYGGGIYTYGTLIMLGGEVSNNTCQSKYANKDGEGGGIYLTPTSSKFWMLGGSIKNNTLSGRAGAGVAVKNVAYIFGGTISGNTMNYKTSKFAEYGGGAIYLLDGTLYLCGGTIGSSTFQYNGSDRTDRTACHKEIFLKNETAKVYLGRSVTGVTIPQAVLDAVGTVTGITVSEDNSTITSTNPLKMEDDDKVAYEINSGNFVYYYSDGTNPYTDVSKHVILKNDLPKNSKVVFTDNDAGYFLTLAADYTPSAATLNAICLAGADSLYNAEVTEAGTELAWPTAEAYQLYQSAALDQSISFRVAFARRDAKADILSDVTVEQITKAQNKETAAWDSKAVNAEWTTGTYNGSPCIVVSLAPKMAMDQIIVKKGDVAVKDEGYTFASYLEGMKENELYSTDTELMALVDATLNYCAAAQNYFNYNNGTLANVGVDTTVGTIPEVTMSLNDPNKIFHSAQVDVASTVSVAIIAKGNVTATVTVGTTPITPEYQDLKDENGEIYTAIVIPDLTAAALMQDITVEIGDASLTYSVPAYAYNMQEKSDDAELVSIVQALYAYAVAADAYAAANAAN